MTALQQSRILAPPEKMELQANGQDLCYIPIEITDEKGIRRPDKEHKIQIQIEGEAVSLAGYGSADPRSDALLILRAGMRTGISEDNITKN